MRDGRVIAPLRIWPQYLIIELSSLHAGWNAGEWSDSAPFFTHDQFDFFLQGAKVDNITRPDYYGPLVRVDREGGEVKFLVHSPVGMDRIIICTSRCWRMEGWRAALEMCW